MPDSVAVMTETEIDAELARRGFGLVVAPDLFRQYQDLFPDSDLDTRYLAEALGDDRLAELVQLAIDRGAPLTDLDAGVPVGGTDDPGILT